MRLTLYTDYSMRVLMYLGAHPDRLCSISEIAGAYGVSQHHLMKVVNNLVNAGYLSSTRGRGGGIRLARKPSTINIGELVRKTEDCPDLVDCGSCVIAPSCGLTRILGEALQAFMATLDRYTLADLIVDRNRLAGLLAGKRPHASQGVKA